MFIVVIVVCRKAIERKEKLEKREEKSLPAAEK